MTLLLLPYPAQFLRSRAILAACVLAPLLVALTGLPVIPAELPTPASPMREAKAPEQVTRLGIDAWHSAGHRGKGVKVAILDSGFRGYREHLGKALPEQVKVRSFRTDGNLEARDSQHGILCGEVIHTLAPEADLLFANWEPDSPERFLDAVRWARKEGAQVISCSIIMPSWSDGEGGGPVHEELTRLLGPGNAPQDMLCFASAGNIAQRHWSGAFRDGGDGFHTWRADEKDNSISPWGSERVSVELCSQAGSCYDLFVYDKATNKEVGNSLAKERKEKGIAVVRFEPETGHEYRIRVKRAEGKGGLFHLSSLAASLDCSTSRGSVPFPSDGPEVIAVGAVDREGRRMGYSSCGPNSPQPKPDFVAPVPFPSTFRSNPFSGTSAAAPQAAAAAALCWSRHPNWTAERVRSALRVTAQDLSAPGHDCETGYGRINLPAVSIDLARLLREKDPALRVKAMD